MYLVKVSSQNPKMRLAKYADGGRCMNMQHSIFQGLPPTLHGVNYSTRLIVIKLETFCFKVMSV